MSRDIGIKIYWLECASDRVEVDTQVSQSTRMFELIRVEVDDSYSRNLESIKNIQTGIINDPVG